MTVGEYLEATGLSEDGLAERVGVAPHSVRSRRARPMPKAWAERLGLERDEWEEVLGPGRAEEHTPQPPPGARVVETPLEGVDFGALAGYIEGAYKLGAYAARASDPALADAIEGHAAQAGAAWAKWVESEPKVAALLQRMMIGTPLGEVVAVHVSIGFSYFVARAAVARARREAGGGAGGEELGDELEPEPAIA